MTTAAQLKKEIATLRKLADKRKPGINQVIIYDHLRGSPDLTGLPDNVYICLPAKDGETSGIWEGPYLSPDPVAV